MNWMKKHWEVLSYLIFGVLTTLLNIVLYALFNTTIIPTLTTKITEMFSYSGT